MATKFQPNQIIPATEGSVRLKGLDVTFTSATEVNKTSNFGEEVIDAITNDPVRLPGKPTYDALTITTPRTESADKKIKDWLKTKDAQPGNVAISIIIGQIYYSFVQCSISQSPVSPAFDRNGTQTTASFITMVLEITNNSKIDLNIETNATAAGQGQL